MFRVLIRNALSNWAGFTVSLGVAFLLTINGCQRFAFSGRESDAAEHLSKMMGLSPPESGPEGHHEDTIA